MGKAPWIVDIDEKKNNKEEEKIRVQFSISVLDLIIRVILSTNRHISRANISALNDLFKVIDIDYFKNDKEKIKRISFIVKLLQGRIENNIENRDVLYSYACGGLFEDIDFMIDNVADELSIEEINYINKCVSEILKNAYIYRNIDSLADLIVKFKSEDGSTTHIVSELENKFNDFMAYFREKQSDESLSDTFSLGYLGNNLEGYMSEVHDQTNNPSAKLRTMMQSVNEMTSGGFESKRCYIIFGMSGMFKTGFLTNLVRQLKIANPDYKTKDPNKKPAIVLLTMEDSVEQVVTRMFNIGCDGDKEFDAYTKDEVINKIKKSGEWLLSSDNPIDIIIKYKPNGSVTTNYLYDLYDELQDKGIEMICLVQDYVRRIRSIRKHPDIRLELGEIINEFKTFSILKDIPVITAAQLNRDASRTFEEGRAGSKQDLIRMLGRSNVGESMLLIDNCDWAMCISLEHDQKGNLFLGMNRIKCRFRSKSRNIMFHPFMDNSTIGLYEDLMDNNPAYKISLVEMNNIIEQEDDQYIARRLPVRKSIEDMLYDKKEDNKKPIEINEENGYTKLDFNNINNIDEDDDIEDNVLNNIDILVNNRIEEYCDSSGIYMPLFIVESDSIIEPMYMITSNNYAQDVFIIEERGKEAIASSP